MIRKLRKKERKKDKKKERKNEEKREERMCKKGEIEGNKREKDRKRV